MKSFFSFLLLTCSLASHISPDSGDGSEASPFMMPAGETDPMSVKDHHYLVYDTKGIDQLNFVLYPCFGALDIDIYVGKPASGSADHQKLWPVDATEHHGNHIWDPFMLDVKAADNVTVKITNKFEKETSYTVDAAKDEKLFLVPGDGEMTIEDVTATSATVKWEMTENKDDEYKIFYHIGSEDGKMKPGHLMGTACAIDKLKELHGSEVHVEGSVDDDSHDGHDHSGHDHDHRKRAEDHSEHKDHTVVSAFEWTKGKSMTVLKDLKPNTKSYHVDVAVRRKDGDNHYITRSYHSEIITTLEGDDSASGHLLLVNAVLLVLGVVVTQF